MIEHFRDIEFYWVVFSADKTRSQEASESANTFLKHAPQKHITIKDFRDGFFPYVGAEIKEHFEQIKQEFSPALILTHCRDDLHQDHRIICDLTWNTFRNHFILEYEVPKYDGDLGSPNFFVHLDDDMCHRKVEYILSSFRTQKSKHWFTEDTFLSILRLRGVESCTTGRYAEAFYCRKIGF